MTNRDPFTAVAEERGRVSCPRRGCGETEAAGGDRVAVPGMGGCCWGGVECHQPGCPQHRAAEHPRPLSLSRSAPPLRASVSPAESTLSPHPLHTTLLGRGGQPLTLSFPPPQHLPDTGARGRNGGQPPSFPPHADNGVAAAIPNPAEGSHSPPGPQTLVHCPLSPPGGASPSPWVGPPPGAPRSAHLSSAGRLRRWPYGTATAGPTARGAPGRLGPIAGGGSLSPPTSPKTPQWHRGLRRPESGSAVT